MKNLIAGGLATLLCLGTALARAEDMPTTWDGLTEIKPKRVDAAYLLPGADFRPYTKLMIDPVEVAFEKNWVRDFNREATGTSRDLKQEDIDRITGAVRQHFAEVFTEAYGKAGLALVTEPGPDVLRVRPGVIDLFIAAPDVQSAGRSRTYTMEAGHATLFLEVRDSTTGTLLGRALDKRATRESGYAQVTNSVTNLSDFRAL
ncbi:MAG TPA: DUF3313 family protein, partial [Vicinamibacterales bacterium]|nr:DUF3313 family protein [Vicinamibacterales bacterium]